jgi:alpha-L-arabinofuranosidase
VGIIYGQNQTDPRCENVVFGIPPLQVKDQRETTIWAQFKGVDPNSANVEINARQAVFYPSEPGRNFITVRGFTMTQAATPWAPPTAEQIGLIGTHWSKGWIIEDNIISHSVCTGITLGKHGDEYDNTSANSADGYIKTIERARENRIAWTKENIGHHVVRNNTISHCEQAGIVGSLGAVFSEISGNHIHHIWFRRHFQGAEMGGIKIHAAIDMLIRKNRIHHVGRAAIWLDWMAQGSRVTGNLCHDNTDEDLFVEVNHGPFLADNNVFLSPVGINDQSQGGAFVHNLITGKILSVPDPYRNTPYHKAHSTVPGGRSTVAGGDCRYYNNFFAMAPNFDGLSVYNGREQPLQTGGNFYDANVRPYAKELDAANHSLSSKPVLLEEGGKTYLSLTLGQEIRDVKTTSGYNRVAGQDHRHGTPI